MKKTLNFLLMLVMVATALSCTKKDAEPVKKIVGKYKMTASSSTYGRTGGAFTTIDTFTDDPACRKDDVIEYTTDNKLIFSEGATSCTPPTATLSINYELSADEKKLQYVYPLGKQEWTVLELTGNVLKITNTFTDNSGITETDTETYVKF